MLDFLKPTTEPIKEKSLPREIKTAKPETTHLAAALVNLAYYVFEDQKHFHTALQMLKIKFGDRFEVILRSDWIESCHKSRLKAVAVKETKDDDREIIHIAIGGTTEQQDFYDSIYAMAASHFGYTHIPSKTTSIREFINHKNLLTFKYTFKEICGHSLGGISAMHMVCELAAARYDNWSCETLSSLRSQHIIETEVALHNKNPNSNRYFLGADIISFKPEDRCINYSSPGDFGFATGPDWGNTIHVDKPLPPFKTKDFCRNLSGWIDGFKGNYDQHALEFFLPEKFYKQEEVLKENPKLFTHPNTLSQLFESHSEYLEDLLSLVPPFHSVCEELLQKIPIIGDDSTEVGVMP